jgi:hypothetical protein
MITQEQLKAILNYNPDNGEFIWLVDTYGGKAGEIAGGKHNKGYISIYVLGKCYLAHRLAWLYVYGYFPENSLDHINRKRNDNCICNLREASRQCNARNSKIHYDNRSGFTGVVRANGKWKASIAVDSEAKYLGTYSNIIEAALHRLAAEQCLGWGDCDMDKDKYAKILATDSAKDILTEELKQIISTLTC